MNEFVSISAALSDEPRVRILMSLVYGELCVCQVVELLGLAPSTVSKHLLVMRQAGLVDLRKTGRWCYYRLSDAPSALASEVIGLAARHLKKSGRIKDDLRRLKRIRSIGPERLCRIKSAR